MVPPLKLQSYRPSDTLKLVAVVVVGYTMSVAFGALVCHILTRTKKAGHQEEEGSGEGFMRVLVGGVHFMLPHS